MGYYENIIEATDYIKNLIREEPKIAIVLGTGLGKLGVQIEDAIKIPYEKIPHFPVSTVKGHEGSLIYGNLNGIKVIAQSGRFHYYEGYSMKEVTLPIRVFKFLGVKALIIASATGGIHENFYPGDVSIVNDHINLHSENPLTGPNDERLGPRFPDMKNAYSPDLLELAHSVAEQQNITLHNSVYGGLPGPNLETKAEYNFLHHIGASVVGMSTVPEVIVAKHMDLKTCVFAAITNRCFPVSEIQEVTHDEVIEKAQIAEYKITSIVKEMIQKI